MFRGASHHPALEYPLLLSPPCSFRVAGCLSPTDCPLTSWPPVDPQSIGDCSRSCVCACVCVRLVCSTLFQCTRQCGSCWIKGPQVKRLNTQDKRALFIQKMEFFFLGILGRCRHFGKPVSRSPPEGVLIVWVIYSLLCIRSGGGDSSCPPSPEALSGMHRHRDPHVWIPEADSYLLPNRLAGHVCTLPSCVLTTTAKTPIEGRSFSVVRAAELKSHPVKGAGLNTDSILCRRLAEAGRGNPVTLLRSPSSSSHTAPLAGCVQLWHREWVSSHSVALGWKVTLGMEGSVVFMS